MAKKKKEENALNLDDILYKCRNHLRSARNSGSFFEKKRYDVNTGIFALYWRKIRRWN